MMPDRPYQQSVDSNFHPHDDVINDNLKRRILYFWPIPIGVIFGVICIIGSSKRIACFGSIGYKIGAGVLILALFATSVLIYSLFLRFRLVFTRENIQIYRQGQLAVNIPYEIIESAKLFDKKDHGKIIGFRFKFYNHPALRCASIEETRLEYGYDFVIDDLNWSIPMETIYLKIVLSRIPTLSQGY